MNLSEIINFSSKNFLAFWLIGFIVFWIVPQNFKTKVLLALSYFFYSCFHLANLLVLGLTTLLDFYFAKIIYERRKEGKDIRPYVVACVVNNIAILIFFKYMGFSSFNFDNTFSSIAVPLGISFFTLQSIGYILDVARGKQEPERNFITYALFVSFFPQIIAGPIERASEILPQYKKYFNIKEINWSLVLYLFSYGFMKKYLIADNIADVLDKTPIDGNANFGIRYLTLVLFFLRIYCDFSGYTDMARGIAHVFTINLKENFNFPLFATSPQDFWDRWHMSLGRWVKNYFYVPVLVLVSNPFIAIAIIFPVMGLWHGPNINFFFWGSAWAMLIILLKKLNIKLFFSSYYLSMFLMFNISSILMIFYKVRNFNELTNYFQAFSYGKIEVAENLLAVSMLALAMMLFEFVLFLKNDKYYIVGKNYYVQLIFYMTLIFAYRHFAGIAAQQVFYLQF